MPAPDALLLLSTHCPHCPAVLAALADLVKQGAIGRTDFPRGDHAALLAAIRGKLFPLGDDVRFVPGHGAMSTFGHERRENPFVGLARD